MSLGVPRGSGGLCTSGAGASLPRRVSCCYLAYRVLLCVARVGGFVCVNSRSCLVLAARYQILGGTGAAPPLFLRCGFYSDAKQVQIPSI